MKKTYAYGFPRIGENREFKKNVEFFWSEKISQQTLLKEIFNIQDINNKRYSRHVDFFPSGEVTLYDPMLDLSILFGLFKVEDIQSYYSLCRDEFAFEMKKWFNTNYHYLITDFSRLKSVNFSLQWDHFSLMGKNDPKCNCPSFIGPFTFLKLSKGLSRNEFEKRFFELIPLYQEILKRVSYAQIEEPAFVFELEEHEIDLIKKGYHLLEKNASQMILMTYYDSIDWIDSLLELPFFALGIDCVRGQGSFNYILEHGFPSEKIFIAGLIDGRNIWKADLNSVVEKAKKMSQRVKNFWVSNGAPLFHLPVSLDQEKKLNPILKSQLCFAKEKLKEISLIGHSIQKGFSLSRSAREFSHQDQDYGFNEEVKKRVKNLNAKDFNKKITLLERRKLQDKILDLPFFPTTTIGSFPQTADVRKKRFLWKKGELSDQDYKKFIQSKIDEAISFQENLDLDVFVHGEFERSDMVEFFAHHLDGIETTQHGWVLSYGTRIYRPPLIYGDVQRSHSMSLDEIIYAQKKSLKPVKGMLTGAVTIIAWSFCREDIPVSDVAYQISLAIKDEIEDYERQGIFIVQVDEAAFREMAPLKKRKWADYFDWAVKSFNLATCTRPETQIHTHMCYSKFLDIIEFIVKMDFDVISIEASKSRGEIISAFESIDFKGQIGLGIWDIHSVAVPQKQNINDIIERSLENIPFQNFWLNPDCGLKTRSWTETQHSLERMVDIAKEYRKKVKANES